MDNIGHVQQILHIFTGQGFKCITCSHWNNFPNEFESFGYMSHGKEICLKAHVTSHTMMGASATCFKNMVHAENFYILQNVYELSTASKFHKFCRASEILNKTRMQTDYGVNHLNWLVSVLALMCDK